MLPRSMDSPHAQAMFLRTLPAIRARCAQVHDLAKKGALQYFDYDPGKLDAVIAFCASIMEVRLSCNPVSCSLFAISSGHFGPPPPWALFPFLVEPFKFDCFPD